MSEQPQASPLNRQDWADAMGRRWLDHLPQFESMLAPIGAQAIEAAALKAGERVVDVGCGGGATTLDIAARLGPDGLAVGVDLSPLLVKAAEGKLKELGPRPGAAPAKFVCANAATAALADAPFDVLFSRFGVMFFDDLHAAFAHMRGWLKPGGRTVFACWAPPKENPWILEIEAINKRYAATPDIDPNAPGPFALSDPGKLHAVLAGAGFEEAKVEAWRGGQAIGGPGATPEQAAQFAMTGMSVGQALKDASDETKAKARADVVALFRKHHRPEGVLMPSCAWIVTARVG